MEAEIWLDSQSFNVICLGDQGLYNEQLTELELPAFYVGRLKGASWAEIVCQYQTLYRPDSQQKV